MSRTLPFWEWGKRYRLLQQALGHSRHFDHSASPSSTPAASMEEHVARKAFHIGEIHNLSSRASEDFSSGRVAREGLVTKDNIIPGHPVEMAPSANCPVHNDWIFTTSALGKPLQFLLFYRKPVNRYRIELLVGEISDREKSELLGQLRGLRGCELP